MHYPNIDMQQTGIRIHQLIKESGYTVKQIQEYLHLSCPQPIYRWFKGQILPSLDHVYAISKLLHVHMEDMLVTKSTAELLNTMENTNKSETKRYLAYYYRVHFAA